MPPRILPSRLYDEAGKVGAPLHWLVTVSIPGQTLRMARAGTSVQNLGHFDGVIKNFGTINRSVLTEHNSLELPEHEIEFDDTSKAFSKLVAKGAAIYRAPVTLQLAHRDLPTSEWHTEISGLIRRWPKVGISTWRLVVRQDDAWLNAPFPRVQITQADWPDAVAGSLGLWAPIIYGSHDSRSLGGKGAVPCYKVATQRFMVCLGIARNVPRIYKDGVLQGSGYSIAYPIVGGRQYTTVDTTTDWGTSVVTVDVDGMTADGTAATGAIGVPTETMRHLITNWMFGDYKSGAWLSESTAPIEPTFWSDGYQFLVDRGYFVSRRYGGSSQTTVKAALDEFAESLQGRLFWTTTGKLGFAVDDHAFRQRSIVPNLIYDLHLAGGELPIDYQSDNLVDSILTNYLYSEADGRYMRDLEVRDPSLGYHAPSALPQRCSFASLAPNTFAADPPATMQTLYPDGTTNSPGGLTISGAATVHEALDDSLGLGEDDANYVESNAVTPLEPRVSLQNMPTNTYQVSSVTLYARARYTAGGGVVRPFLYIGSTKYVASPNPALSTSYQTFSWTYTLNPATSAAWTKSDLDALQLGAEVGGDGVNSGRLTSVSVQVSYDALAAQQEQSRDAASRRWLEYSRNRPIITVKAALLQWLDVSLMSHVDLSHVDGPAVDGSGWGLKKWQRRLCRVLGRAVNPADNTVEFQLLDLRRRLYTWYEDFRAKQNSPLCDGVIRIGIGGTRAVVRNLGGNILTTESWYKDPASGKVILIAPGQEAFETDGSVWGEVFDGYSANHLFGSSFKDQLTGWTLQGTGTNGSAVTADATDQSIFDSTVSGYSAKLQAGNPLGGTDLAILSTATVSMGGPNAIRLSIDHKDDSGAALSWELKRGSDNKYWNNAGSGSWQVGQVWNTLPVRSTATRDRIGNPITTGAATTYTVRLAARTTNGQIDHVYHVQLSDIATHSGRIVTSASGPNARNGVRLTISNNSGKRCWPNDKGTAMMQLVPGWNSAEEAYSFIFLKVLYADAGGGSNWYMLYYDALGRLIFQNLRAGASVAAIYTGPFTAGQSYKIAIRWISTAGELGEAPYTLDLFLDGVKVATATASGPPIESASSTMYIGSDDINGSAFATVVKAWVSPEVYTDEEIAQL